MNSFFAAVSEVEDDCFVWHNFDVFHQSMPAWNIKLFYNGVQILKTVQKNADIFALCKCISDLLFYSHNPDFSAWRKNAIQTKPGITFAPEDFYVLDEQGRKKECISVDVKGLCRIMELCDGQLKLYSNVTETNVDWLWYPYIPFGKITLLQGDPGCGKSTLMMNIISSISSGSFFPDGRKIKKPMHVIYQCSEDGAGDTIKPRLNAAGADCRNVAFLDEEMDWLTLGDEKIRRAIADFNAKLLVIDPVQAYLGDADISNATGMRKMLRQLAIWASLYDCAIVLIGHLNKKESSKDLYRSLGSIDLIAAARSVLQISTSEEDGIMVMHHVKSSLAQMGGCRKTVL